jgi:magnesium transporter
LGSLMRTDLFTLHCFVDREEAAAELAKRRYFAAPVVDHEGHILGIIKAEQLIHGVQEEMSKDIQRMFGAGGDERAFSPITYSLRKRLPWLHVNLATAFLAAAVVALFEDIIARITVLAVFLPVVAGQGGNAGAQSLAIVMRGLVMREIPKSRVKPSLDAGESHTHAAELFLHHGIAALPVVDGGRFLGMLGQGALCDAADDLLERDQS